MPSRNQSLFSLSIFLLFFSCNTQPNMVTRSYYYWRSGNAISSVEKAFLRENNISKLYVRAFDVDWNEVQGSIPIFGNDIDYFNRQLNVYDSLKVSIVPVIFITNKTFQKIDSADIPTLAQRVLRRGLPAFDSADIIAEKNYGSNRSGPFPAEIQFDCDWTVSTAKKYFYFLQTVRSLLLQKNTLLSATIRLHQFKYPEKTGVPPVDRGILMVYNVNSATEHSSVNSIFDNNKAGLYFTKNKKYALPLDFALPAFSWSIVFRKGKFYQIENALSKETLDTCQFLSAGKNGFYQVLQDTVFRNLFLRPGDEIKAETVGNTELQQAAKLARKAIDTDSFSVSLFELSENEIKNYSHETINSVYNSFR